MQQLLPEAVISTYTEYRKEELKGLLSWADAICIGSGIGTKETACKLLETTLQKAEVPCLVDADGLNLLAGHWEEMEYSKDVKTLVLTPHMKEMSRLVRRSVGELKEGRMGILGEFVESQNCTCVLKDSRTVVASPTGGMYVNRSGNASMAKAGSGDVLAGIIAGLLAQGMDGHRASVLGVYLHGRSGDYAQAAKGSYSVMAQDLLLYLSEAFKELEF